MSDQAYENTIFQLDEQIAELEQENKALKKGMVAVLDECCQENMDGEPYDTFYKIAQKALKEARR